MRKPTYLLFAPHRRPRGTDKSIGSCGGDFESKYFPRLFRRPTVAVAALYICRIRSEGFDLLNEYGLQAFPPCKNVVLNVDRIPSIPRHADFLTTVMVGTRESATMKRSFFARPAVDVAPDLIGLSLVLDGVGGIIVECEAYDAADPASHSYRSRVTDRNKAMFGAAGRAYVYRIYGLHWCLNFVCGGSDGHAVLIRALEPTTGLNKMRLRRGIEGAKLLCRGPGRLCQALGITDSLDGSDLLQPPFAFSPRQEPVRIVTGRRVGISRAIALRRRYGLYGSAFLSRVF
jgi:DNA-3-methyladenine glycosylase